MANDIPCDFILQLEKIQKYIEIKPEDNKNLNQLLVDIGYYRLSRYGKILLSIHNAKQPSYLLLRLYNFDKELRVLLFRYCKICELQIKSYISNYVSLETSDSEFYLNDVYYTKSKGEKDKKRKKNNIDKFSGFIKSIKDKESFCRKVTNLYPEFSAYTLSGFKSGKKIPSWAIFSQFEFGTIIVLFSYLNLKYKKKILRNKYPSLASANGAVLFYNWLKRLNQVRNCCAHHNILIHKNFPQINRDVFNEEINLLNNTQDLFSILYVLKKVLPLKDTERLYEELKKLIIINEIDVEKYRILPQNWEELYFKVKNLYV